MHINNKNIENCIICRQPFSKIQFITIENNKIILESKYFKFIKDKHDKILGISFCNSGRYTKEFFEDIQVEIEDNLYNNHQIDIHGISYDGSRNGVDHYIVDDS